MTKKVTLPFGRNALGQVLRAIKGVMTGLKAMGKQQEEFRTQQNMQSLILADIVKHVAALGPGGNVDLTQAANTVDMLVDLQKANAAKLAGGLIGEPHDETKT
jgi:hypothetical protein